MSSKQQEELFNSSQLDLEQEEAIRQYKEQMLRTVLPMVEDHVSRSWKMTDYNLLSQEIISKSVNKVNIKWREMYEADRRLNSVALLRTYIENQIKESIKTPRRRKKFLEKNECSLLVMSVIRSADYPIEPELDYQRLLKALKETLTPREYDSLISKAETGRADVSHLALKYNCSRKTIYNSIASAEAKARKLLGK